MDYAALSNNRCVSDQLGTFGRRRIITSMLSATRLKSRTCATRETDVISECKHCSRRRRHTQVELSSPLKCADKTQTIAGKRWHGARKRKRWNIRSTCGRFRVLCARLLKLCIAFRDLFVLRLNFPGNKLHHFLTG